MLTDLNSPKNMYDDNDDVVKDDYDNDDDDNDNERNSNNEIDDNDDDIREIGLGRWF